MWQVGKCKWKCFWRMIIHRYHYKISWVNQSVAIFVWHHWRWVCNLEFKASRTLQLFLCSFNSFLFFDLYVRQILQLIFTLGCTFFWCCIRLSFLTHWYSHRGHWIFSPFKCFVFRCLFKSPLLTVLYWHKLHLKSFSTSCTFRTWTFKVRREKDS